MKLIDGDLFESLADISFGDMYTVQRIPNKDEIKRVHDTLGRDIIVYIETSRIGQLLKAIEDLDFGTVIITHNSDATISDNIEPYIPNNVIKIWSQNYSGNLDIIKPLPIGLERRLWFPERKKQEKILKLYNKRNEIKANEIYANFNINTNPIRIKWKNAISDKVDVITRGNDGGFDDYINNLHKSKFTISPPGNGIDSHRNWEALYVGSIPVMEDNKFNRIIFSGLPVLLIDDIDKMYDKIYSLPEAYSRIFSEFDLRKLNGEYWEELIKLDIKTYGEA